MEKLVNWPFAGQYGLNGVIFGVLVSISIVAIVVGIDLILR